MPLTRRAALLTGGAALLGVGLPLSHLFGRRPPAPRRGSRFGPVRPDPAGIFDLPEGFRYRVVDRSGSPMSDGYRVPMSFDGMASFPGPDGTVILLRNHENTWFGPTGPCNPGQAPPEAAYDRDAQGGVTRLVLRADTLERVSSNLVLAGTLRNCAGGPSPWGYLSCEEAVDPGHGYVFRCPVDATQAAAPHRIDGYGRFRHEAVCIDPTTSVAYLTEDRDDGCLYRFVPKTRERPFEGRLEAMAAVGWPRAETATALPPGGGFDVDWVPIERPMPDDDTVRLEAARAGAARIRRGEGIWFDSGRVFVCSTTGGAFSKGQIFRLTLGSNGGRDRLDLLAQAGSEQSFDMPDNIALAPWGDLVLAEDAVFGHQGLKLLTAEGEVFEFGRNMKSSSELAGVCFSPDASTLFVNLYGDGLTLAIRGPFRSA